MRSPLRRLALAVNPTSGRGRGRAAGELAVRVLRADGAEVSVLVGDGAGDLAAQVRTAIAGGVDALVVVGGDGMVQLGVGAVAGTGTPLGIVPAGTGNDAARALDLPRRDPAAAASAVLTGQHRRIDIVRVRSGPHTWHVAGVLGAGFDAVVNERANRWRRPRGRARYVLAMLRELPAFTAREYVLTLDGETHRVRAMLVAVGNGPSYGGGMRIAPAAVLDDGQLDVVWLPEVSTGTFLRIFPRVYRGSHVRDPRVVLRRAREVTVALSVRERRPIVAYGDGERLGPLPLTCTVCPGAVTILGARG